MEKYTMTDSPLEWWTDQPKSVIKLYEKAENFRHLFSDMLFLPDSRTADFVSSQIVMDDGREADQRIPADLPPELDMFSYAHFRFCVRELDDDVLGQFDRDTQELTVTASKWNSDPVLLHEMIHLHEFVLDALPIYFHEICLISLYGELSRQLDDLDARIRKYADLDTSVAVRRTGGFHDVLFLLKSYDLDLKMDYDLGTVYGYGMTDERS